MTPEILTMTIPEFAAVFSISRGLAYDLARRNALPVPVIKLGKRMVLSRKAVEGLLSGVK
jgi:predicted DNA-binding transcriptional regulator AlpA